MEKLVDELMKKEGFIDENEIKSHSCSDEQFVKFLIKLSSKKPFTAKELPLYVKSYSKFISEKSKTTSTERTPAPIRLVKSKANNMIHEPTNLVFIPTKSHGNVCIGVEIDNELKPLTMKHCILCSQNAWKYSIRHCIKSAIDTSYADCAVNIE